jgi:hypothetical protein
LPHGGVADWCVHENASEVPAEGGGFVNALAASNTRWSRVLLATQPLGC